MKYLQQFSQAKSCEGLFPQSSVNSTRLRDAPAVPRTSDIPYALALTSTCSCVRPHWRLP